MAKQTIKIKRWKIFIRRVVDELKALAYTAFSWLMRAGQRERRGSGITLLKSSGTIPEPRRSGEVIRINPVATLESSLPPEEEIVLPPLPPVAPKPRVPKADNPAGGNINVTDGIKLCKACGEPLRTGEHKARCQRDPHHTIHRKCAGIMKHKCPHCGGRLS
jgi:hypothetical protein